MPYASQPVSRGSRIVVTTLLGVGGVALLIWQIRTIGVGEVGAGLASVGWGFLLILVVSLLRFGTRAAAWITLLGEPTSFGRGIAAVIAGDAIGNATSLGLLVSEPAKAMYLGNPGGPTRALAALAAENFFYAVSVAIYVILGTAAMLVAFDLDPDIVLAGRIALIAMAAFVALAAWLAWQQPSLVAGILTKVSAGRLAAVVDRVRQFEQDAYGAVGRQRRRLGVVVLWETTFHLLSFAESWLTLWLLTNESLPLAAFVLDTFNRISNVVFKPIPFQVGVDQWGSRILAQGMGHSGVEAVNLSIVRTGRKLFWMVVGFALIARRGLRRSLR